ncbi:ATP-dependent DNA ligase [Bradyrhizobium sp. S3.2.12]
MQTRPGRCRLEGARDGPYPKGRTSDWVKKTCIQRETLTIAGFALDEGKWDGI